MPKSKTRNTRRRLPDRPAAPFAPEKVLETATLALTQASLEIVREAEAHITLAARTGEGVEEALEIHHLLRTGSLALLTAYSRLAGLPDPRESEVLTQD
jgi:hypothetical protein